MGHRAAQPPVKSARRARRAHLQRAHLHTLDTCHGGTWSQARSSGRYGILRMSIFWNSPGSAVRSKNTLTTRDSDSMRILPAMGISYIPFCNLARRVRGSGRYKAVIRSCHLCPTCGVNSGASLRLLPFAVVRLRLRSSRSTFSTVIRTSFTSFVFAYLSHGIRNYSRVIHESPDSRVIRNYSRTPSSQSHPFTHVNR